MKEAQRILIALGSPRRGGSSALLAQKAAEGAVAAGARCETISLHEMHIKPCCACDHCQTSPGRACLLKDDMQKLYPKLLAADALIMAGPVYWFTVSAQTKLFMDRWYALARPGSHALRGKRIGIILSYGDADPYASGAVNAIRTFQDAFRYIGAPIAGVVYGTGNDPREVKKDRKLMRAALELGRSLVK